MNLREIEAEALKLPEQERALLAERLLASLDEPPGLGADDPAVLTTWKMVVKYAAELFARDNLVVVGARADWCLYYHHDDVLTFARDPDFSKVRG